MEAQSERKEQKELFLNQNEKNRKEIFLNQILKDCKRKFLKVLFILIEYKWYAVGLSDNPTVPQAAPLTCKGSFFFYNLLKSD